MIVSGAAPPMVDALRRVRRWMSRRAVLPFLPCALASADGIRPFPMIAPSVNVLRRTRRKPSTIRGAAPDVVIGQSAAARAGAHPYRAGEVARRFTASPPRTALKTANSSGDRRTTSPLYARRYASLPSFEPGGQCLTRSLGANAKAERCPGRFQQT